MSDVNSLSEHLLDTMNRRHSVRKFSNQPVDIKLIENCIRIAGSAPSGANMQPWTFVVITDQLVKRKIRQGAESVERNFYETKITEEWEQKLKKLEVDTGKPFLEEAPVLICVFVQRYGVDENGERVTHYYPGESVGLATGFLVAALHLCGLSTLTYTPAPMSFLVQILKQSKNERPYMILPVGYAHPEYYPPEIKKKNLSEIMVHY